MGDISELHLLSLGSIQFGEAHAVVGTILRVGYLVRRNLSLRSASSIIMEAKVSSFDQIAASKRDFESFAGIKAFVSDLEGFNGIQKQRFSDFIVEEVIREGRLSVW